MGTADNILVMLESLQKERAAIRERDEALKAREATLREWLKEERLTASPMQHQLLTDGETSELAQFLLSVLASGKKLDAGQLGALADARGLIEEGVSPGRSVHGVMLALQKNGLAEKGEDGHWRRP